MYFSKSTWSLPLTGFFFFSKNLFFSSPFAGWILLNSLVFLTVVLTDTKVIANTFFPSKCVRKIDHHCNAFSCVRICLQWRHKAEVR